MSGFDSVGTLLADVANLIAQGRRILDLADKRHWGPDEHEQLRALDAVLEDARKDFQELSPLVHGASHYEHDRRHESVEELRALRSRFRSHVVALKDWARSGGPIDPVWTRDTHALQRDLHRAQCRAARRIFTSDRESSRRCLGAFLVRRVQRRREPRPAGADAGPRARLLAELRACASAGGFERLVDHDITFVCDFCDGHIVWDDLEDVPVPVPAPAPAAYPRWQASGASAPMARPKQVVAAPVAVANHMPPAHGDWRAPLLCPYCEDEAQVPLDDDGGDDAAADRPANEFDDLAALQEHLEWKHTAMALRVALPSADKCVVM